MWLPKWRQSGLIDKRVAICTNLVAPEININDRARDRRALFPHTEERGGPGENSKPPRDA